MFGVDFSELMVILVVALIVIGPERLPKVARTMGALWGRGQRYINSVKADIARDMAADELREMRQRAQEEANKIQKIMTETSDEFDQQARELHDAVIQSAQPEPSSPTQPVTEQKKISAE